MAPNFLNAETMKIKYVTKAPVIRSNVAHINWPGIPVPSSCVVLAVMFQLEQSQWWSPELLAARQYSQIEVLLAFVTEAIPFYRQHLKKIGWKKGVTLDADIFSKLPILQRNEIQAQSNAIFAHGTTEHGKRYNKYTSGSSGSPLNLMGSEVSTCLTKAMAFRDDLWQQRDFSKRFLRIRSGRQAAEPLAIKDSPTWGFPAAGVYDTGPMTVFTHRLPIAQQAEALRARNPAYIQGYTSNILELTDYFRANNLTLPGLLSVTTYGEPTTEDVHAACRDVWGVPVIPIYSCEEFGFIALQCPQHAHYHVNSESVLLEVLDEHNQPCKPGQYGRVVLTTLNNFVTPLIRYEIGDIAQIGEACPCGRGLAVLKNIAGRRRNMALLEDGVYCIPKVSRDVWRQFREVERCQFVQTEKAIIDIRIAVNHPLDDKQKQSLIADVAAAIKHPFSYTVTEIDDLSRHQANGKFDTFICELPWPEKVPPRIIP